MSITSTEATAILLRIVRQVAYDSRMPMTAVHVELTEAHGIAQFEPTTHPSLHPKKSLPEKTSER